MDFTNSGKRGCLKSWLCHCSVCVKNLLFSNNEILHCVRNDKNNLCLTFGTPSPVKNLRNFYHAQISAVAYLGAFSVTGKCQVAMKNTA